jgi:hypothetical protein
MWFMGNVKASVKFISFEPLLERCTRGGGVDLLQDTGINWVIIGQQTPVKISTMPKMEWVKEIVTAADTAGIPVFLKDNLKELLPQVSPFYFLKSAMPVINSYSREFRQEFPKQL